MCFTANISLTSFVFMLVGIVLLYIRNFTYDRFFIPYLFFLATIQLGEFFIWSDIDCKNNLNFIGNMILYFSLYFQCIALIIGLYFLDSKLKYNIKYITYFYFIYIILFTINLIYYLYTNKNIFVCIHKYINHLSWNIPVKIDTIIFYIIYFTTPLFLLSIKNNIISYFTIFYFYFSFMLSYFKYSVGNEWKSIWCFMAIISPYILLLYGYFTE